ncbi:hypothetical protein [Geoalkalibacter subterraneus]|uniref:Uncharacterized protein n=1 Tax=Geoalkalibacter subterraneus TaxID=483547 RepID=A0A0B5FV42_9BACT|nr:hypothetical protein [Geoalkalibacter subterraneus]AJF07486.1 hypothetical protein GSUB_14295 [Geoalkalibacter subterraneus]
MKCDRVGNQVCPVLFMCFAGFRRRAVYRTCKEGAMGESLKRVEKSTLLVPLLAGLATLGFLAAAAGMNVGSRALGLMAAVALVWGAGFPRHEGCVHATDKTTCLWCS